MGRNLNLRIWVFTACVVFMGLVVLYSASYENARVSVKVFYDQLYCAALGFTLMYVISRMDYRRFYSKLEILDDTDFARIKEGFKSLYL